MNMESVKKTVAVVSILACLPVLVSCGAKSEVSGPAGGQEAKKVVIGYDRNSISEGFDFTETPDYRFFIRDAVQNLGWNAEYKGIEFADIEQSINDGTIDCYWSCYTIQGREDMYAWSEAYMRVRPALVCKASDSIFGSLSTDLPVPIEGLGTVPEGKTIGTVAGGVIYDNMAAGQKEMIDRIGTIKEYPGFIQCRDALDEGEIDMILTEMDATFMMFGPDNGYSVFSFETTDTASYGVAFKKGNEEMAEAVTEAMRELYKSGKLQENISSPPSVPSDKSNSHKPEEVGDGWKIFAEEWLLK